MAKVEAAKKTKYPKQNYFSYRCMFFGSCLNLSQIKLNMKKNEIMKTIILESWFCFRCTFRKVALRKWRMASGNTGEALKMLRIEVSLTVEGVFNTGDVSSRTCKLLFSVFSHLVRSIIICLKRFVNHKVWMKVFACKCIWSQRENFSFANIYVNVLGSKNVPI